MGEDHAIELRWQVRLLPSGSLARVLQIRYCESSSDMYMHNKDDRYTPWEDVPVVHDFSWKEIHLMEEDQLVEFAKRRGVAGIQTKTFPSLGDAADYVCEVLGIKPEGK